MKEQQVELCRRQGMGALGCALSEVTCRKANRVWRSPVGEELGESFVGRLTAWGIHMIFCRR